MFSTMDKQRGPIKKILYGQDDDNLYFAFMSKAKKMCTGSFVNIMIEPLDIKAKLAIETQKTFIGSLEIELACDDIFEMSISKKLIDVDSISITFEIEQDKKIVQSLPGFGDLKIDLGSDYSKNWFI